MMSNQVVLWATVLVPWLTLFFMKREEIKRFIPVGMFSALISIIVVETGQTLGWFAFGETAFPLKTPSYIFGLNVITAMWLFYFLYGRFWVYLAVDTALNFGFIYVFHVYFLGSRGIFHEVGITPWVNALITTVFGILTYGYQVWQEGGLKQTQRSRKQTAPGLEETLSKKHASPRK